MSRRLDEVDVSEKIFENSPLALADQSSMPTRSLGGFVAASGDDRVQCRVCRPEYCLLELVVAAGFTLFGRALPDVAHERTGLYFAALGAPPLFCHI